MTIGNLPTSDERGGDEPSVEMALQRYLREIGESRSPLTHKAYSQALQRWSDALREHGVNVAITPVSSLAVDWLGVYLDALRGDAVATERLYLTAVVGFYEFVAAESWAQVNLPALKRLRRRRARREATRLPPFPQDEIERVLETVQQAVTMPVDNMQETLRLLRDCALLIVLADTGLRVSEACSLNRGSLDWREARAVVLGKGSREAVVRFSSRALRHLRAYLEARAELDGAQGRPLSSLPLFARHDRGAGRRVVTLSARSAEKIVAEWVEKALGATARGTITPHTFRHYFVTTVLRSSGGNIRLAQELARHRSVTTTQRYTHLSDDELDRGYHEVFEKTE